METPKQTQECIGIAIELSISVRSELAAQFLEARRELDIPRQNTLMSMISRLDYVVKQLEETDNSQATPPPAKLLWLPMTGLVPPEGMYPLRTIDTKKYQYSPWYSDGKVWRFDIGSDEIGDNVYKFEYLPIHLVENNAS